ncbi:MAG: MFS transporter [Planctomycetota bacterium]
MTDQTRPALTESQIRQAVRLSYAQAMLFSIFAASTGGMFLIGYALKLGADDLRIGLLSSIPMVCVVAQLLSSVAVERGMSRKRLTVIFATLQVLGWACIILIPYAAAKYSPMARVGTLIAIITLVSFFGQIAGNARGSWVGDLIPAAFRGTFFGRTMLYGGIVGTVFALGEGWFLDIAKTMDIGAFSLLFGCGMVFGLISVGLFLPQADVPVMRHADGMRFRDLARATFKNGPLMALIVCHTLWAMQSVAGPFYATYMLRDLHMPFLGVGITNAALMLVMLSTSPFWGRVVDRYGCKPVLIFCILAFAPIQAVWLPLDTAAKVYAVIIPVNLWVGFLIAGVSVAISTLIYNLTPVAGRSVQFAVYGIIVTLIAAPMPAIGGLIPRWTSALGLGSDLRYTFYIGGVFTLLAGLAACRLKETHAKPVDEMVRNLPRHLMDPATLAQMAVLDPPKS